MAQQRRKGWGFAIGRFWIGRRPQVDADWFRELAAQAETERAELRDQLMTRPERFEGQVGEQEVLKGLNAVAEHSTRLAELVEQHGGDVQSALQDFMKNG